MFQMEIIELDDMFVEIIGLNGWSTYDTSCQHIRNCFDIVR